MFSFHKPKVYRSTSGCCICKAKSSSSRFTDSRKYEEDLVECFQLGERRTGEICNACVLLVKRWKKLPQGCGRHWRHVVDYRAGPGSKSLVRAKTRNKKRPKLKAEVRSVSPGPDDDLSSDLSVLSVLSGPNSPTDGRKRSKSPSVLSVLSGPNSPAEICVKDGRKRSKSPSPRKADDEDCGFVDPTVWKRKKICCGIIFTGPGGMVMVDPQLLKPCRVQCSASSPPQEASEATPTAIATPPIAPPPISEETSDSSSDSGFDEFSNHPPPITPTN